MSHSSCLCLRVLDLVPFGQNTAMPCYALRLENPGWPAWRPGQFVMVRPQSFGLDLTWARPLSICNVTDQHLICFFQVVGRGTEKLAQLRHGDSVQVWGPLGNGFAVENVPTLLLAGGVGIVPFVGYAYCHPHPAGVEMLFGHRLALDCYPVESIRECIALETMQERSPADLTAFIEAMRERMGRCAAQQGLVLACGPLPFLRTIKQLAAATGARTQISLEQRMACGVGACLGCVTRTTERYPVPEKRSWPVQVCNHGPVFWTDQVTLE